MSEIQWALAIQPDELQDIWNAITELRERYGAVQKEAAGLVIGWVDPPEYVTTRTDGR